MPDWHAGVGVYGQGVSATTEFKTWPIQQIFRLVRMAKWVRKGAEQNDALAQFSLGS
jgi:hypothetical protein